MNALLASRASALAPVVALMAALAARAPRVAAAHELGWSIIGRPIDRIAGGQERARPGSSCSAGARS